jgi:hypothetical protein
MHWKARATLLYGWAIGRLFWGFPGTGTRSRTGGSFHRTGLRHRHWNKWEYWEHTQWGFLGLGAMAVTAFLPLLWLAATQSKSTRTRFSFRRIRSRALRPPQQMRRSAVQSATKRDTLPAVTGHGWRMRAARVSIGRAGSTALLPPARPRESCFTLQHRARAQSPRHRHLPQAGVVHVNLRSRNPSTTRVVACACSTSGIYEAWCEF